VAAAAAASCNMRLSLCGTGEGRGIGLPIATGQEGLIVLLAKVAPMVSEDAAHMSNPAAATVATALDAG